jgi:hypothetical protein
MNKFDACKILGLGADAEITTETVATAYRRAAMKYHPDRNAGGLQMMQSVNEARDCLVGLLLAGECMTGSDYMRADQASDLGDELMAALNAVSELSGVDVELCGAWIWLSGNTKEHKDAIKAAGFWWSSPKSMWYFRPADYKSYSRKSTEMDTIRNKYGSQAYKSAGRNRITQAA